MPLAVCTYQYFNNQLAINFVWVSLVCSLLYPYSKYTLSLFINKIIKEKYMNSIVINANPNFIKIGAISCVVCYLLAIPVGLPSMIYYLINNRFRQY